MNMIQLICENLLKNVNEKGTAKAVLKTENDEPISNAVVVFKINGVEYSRVTNNEGEALININLAIGSYNCLVTYNNLVTSFNILVTGNACKLEAGDASFVNGEGGNYIVRLVDGAGKGIPNMPIDFTINGVTYTRYTNFNGHTHLGINLNAGSYQITTRFRGVDNYVSALSVNTVTVTQRKTLISLTDLDVVQGEKCIVRLTDYKGNVLAGQEIHFFVNGVEYIRKTDSSGYAGLNINLNPKDYPCTFHFVGNGNYERYDIAGTLKVNSKTKRYTPNSNGWLIEPHYATSKSLLRQETNTSCGPNSLQLCFYSLLKTTLSETTLINRCGTGANGTDHNGLETGIRWAAKQLGLNINIEWCYLSDIGVDELGQYCADPNKAVFTHTLYKNKYGHYEHVIGVNPSSGLVKISNSLSDGYSRGWIENRSYSTFRSYINGISQKSVCVITLK